MDDRSHAKSTDRLGRASSSKYEHHFRGDEGASGPAGFALSVGNDDLRETLLALRRDGGRLGVLNDGGPAAVRLPAQATGSRELHRRQCSAAAPSYDARLHRLLYTLRAWASGCNRHSSLRSSCVTCGRFLVSKSPDEIQRWFKTTNAVPNFAPSYNIAPTIRIPVVRLNPKTRQRSLDLLHWGLIPHWSKDKSVAYKLINARSEGIETKPSFRDAFERRRCIVPGPEAPWAPTRALCAETRPTVRLWRLGGAGTLIALARRMAQPSPARCAEGRALGA
jgi:hypothetical protein